MLMKLLLRASSALLLVSQAFGAILSRETAIPPKYVAAQATSSVATVASNGREFFALWQDSRSLMAWGSRISPDGQPLDPLGIVIADIQWSISPIVVWGGSSWIVVGTRQKQGVQRVVAARLDDEGRVIAGPVELANGAFDPYSPDGIAVNGSRMLIRYTSSSFPNRESAIVVDETLRSIVAADTGGGTLLVPHGDGFAAFAQNSTSGELMVRLIGPDGAIASSTSFPAPARLVTAATDGTDFLLASLSDVFFLRGDLSAMKTTSFAKPFESASLLWAGDHYVLLGRKRDTVTTTAQFLTRIEKDGAIGSETAIGFRLPDCCGRTSAARMAVLGDNLLVAAQSQTLMARLFSAASSQPRREPFALAVSAVPQSHAGIASNAAGMELVVWRESSSAYGARVRDGVASLDDTGIKLLPDNEPRVLDNENAASSVDAPAVVFDGKQFVLPYITNDGRVRARFMTPSEGLLPDELQIAGTFGEPASPGKLAAARGRNNSLVVWPSFLQHQILGARIDAETRQLLAPPLPLLLSPAPDQYVDRPAVAWNGSQYLLVWRELKRIFLPPVGAPGLQPVAIRGMRLSEQLLPIDTVPLTLGAAAAFTISDTIGIVSNGVDWLVTWDFSLRRVFADGTMSETLTTNARMDMAWSGLQYAVAWNESGNVKLAYVPAAGPIELSAPILVAPANSSATVVRLATAGFDRVAVVYDRLASEKIYGMVPRVFFRYVTTQSPGKRRSVRP
jgi:hypothetical protein